MMKSDCRYSNGLRSGGGRRLFQPATQCVYTVYENQSTEQKVIDITVKNKLGKTGRPTCQRNEHKDTSMV